MIMFCIVTTGTDIFMEEQELSMLKFTSFNSEEEMA